MLSVANRIRCGRAIDVYCSGAQAPRVSISANISIIIRLLTCIYRRHHQSPVLLTSRRASDWSRSGGQFLRMVCTIRLLIGWPVLLVLDCSQFNSRQHARRNCLPPFSSHVLYAWTLPDWGHICLSACAGQSSIS